MTITGDHKIVVAALVPFPHPGSSGRFLTAMPEVLSLTLVTADERLLRLGNIATLVNR
jgi:hypothetical protein